MYKHTGSYPPPPPPPSTTQWFAAALPSISAVSLPSDKMSVTMHDNHAICESSPPRAQMALRYEDLNDKETRGAFESEVSQRLRRQKRRMHRIISVIRSERIRYDTENEESDARLAALVAKARNDGLIGDDRDSFGRPVRRKLSF